MLQAMSFLHGLIRELPYPAKKEFREMPTVNLDSHQFSISGFDIKCIGKHDERSNCRGLARRYADGVAGRKVRLPGRLAEQVRLMSIEFTRGNSWLLGSSYLAPSEYARCQSALHPRCPRTTQYRLMQDMSSKVRAIIASRHDSDEKILALAAKDLDAAVRMGAAMGTQTPKTALDTLTHDTNPLIAAIAILNLEQRQMSWDESMAFAHSFTAMEPTDLVMSEAC